jgi:Zn-dependent protease
VTVFAAVAFATVFAIAKICHSQETYHTGASSMQSSWRVGNLFGIPLFVDASWFFVVALLTYLNGSDWQQAYPNWAAGQAWLAGLAMALLLFISVLLHELGHSLVAQAQGIRVNSITLFLFGGVASIDRESKTPGQAFQVAAAGPLVSFILAGLLAGLDHLLVMSAPAEVLVNNLARVNLVLAILNLLPGLPLDGGQILKALVWQISGSRFQGVRWAARSGQVLGWTGIILGLLTLLLLQASGGLWLAMLGWFALRNANAYGQMITLQSALAALTAADAMTNEFRVIDANLTLQTFAERYVLVEQTHACYFAVTDGRYRGLVNLKMMDSIERSLWPSQMVESLVSPLSAIPTVTEKTHLIDVINQLEVQHLPRITVLSPAGTVAGVIDRGDTVRALVKRMNWPVGEAEIQRIKAEGSYPPGLPLGAMAQTLQQELAESDISK